MRLGVKIGIIAAAAVGVIFVAKKVTEKKYADVKATVEEDETVLDKIKKGAVEKVVQILSWGEKHLDQIKTASEIVGLVSGIISLAYGIHQFRTKGKLEKKIDNLENVIKEQNAKKDLYNWVDGFNRGATEQFNRALDEADRCSKNNEPFEFIDKAGNVIGQFKVQEAMA